MIPVAPKSIQGLASAVARREGKKSQARIGEVREILGIVSDLLIETMVVGEKSVELPIAVVLYEAGVARKKKKAKPKGGFATITKIKQRRK